MTQISRRTLGPKVWDRIYDLFLETVSSFSDKKKLGRFLDDFLTPTEKIMLSKRLAIVVLLSKGHDYRSVCELLKVTPTTVSKMSLKVRYSNEGIKPVIGDIYKKQALKVLWEEMRDVFDLPTKATYKSPSRYKRIYLRRKKVQRLKSEF